MPAPLYNSLHDAFYELMSQYASVFDKVSSAQDWKNPFKNIISETIPELLRQGVITDERYKVVGSYGKGRWTKVPWIAVFDTRVTESAQKGAYVVYLLNKDEKVLYLAFANAATEVMDIGPTDDGHARFVGVVGKKSPDVKEKLRERVQKIQQVIKDNYFSKDDKIKCGAEGYDAGTAFYKRYSLFDLPTDDVLCQDLRRMMDIYRRYYDWTQTEKNGTGKNELQESRTGGTEEVSLSIKETVKHIKEYISAKGFSYEGSLIENFYLSLKSKPFVILAGTSGTGKTRLVRLFAEAIGATANNGQYKQVSVRPDWSDSSDLFGHVDLNGRFVPGAVIDFIKDAELHPEKPYFLCLDEMNLARVEYYLSDYLSVIETREKRNGHIVTDPIVTASYFGPDSNAAGKYGNVIIPDNLYVVGTVNMDETTFPFSRKVLDRANTIEFSFVKLNGIPEPAPSDMPEPLNLSNGFLKTEYLKLQDCLTEDANFQALCDKLEVLNGILQKAGAHVGYRVRDEIVFYLLNNKKSGLLTEGEALDNEIMQKILPRIQGSGSSVRNLLCDLFRFCADGEYSGFEGNSDSEQMTAFLEQKSKGKYPKSAEKIVFMTRRFEEDGFTSYWL